MTYALAKYTISAAARCLNQPLIKEGVKNVAGSITCLFGVIEAYDLIQILRGREVSTESASTDPQWLQTAHKVTIVCAKVSLILSAATSRPGAFVIANVIDSLFSVAQLEQAFGPNTIFAINPWHPRHVVSIAAVLLALPAVAQFAYKSVAASMWLTDAKIRIMALFNSITSRPILHVGNQFARWFIKI